jgi:hypothetical protein
MIIRLLCAPTTVGLRPCRPRADPEGRRLKGGAIDLGRGPTYKPRKRGPFVREAVPIAARFPSSQETLP